MDQAWQALTDLELIAPCLPGAQLDEVNGDEHRGHIRVKLGPIATHFAGMAVFKELDEGERRVVLAASGKDKRGAGTAEAEIVALLREDGARTTVDLTTDLQISGRIAQFGRGVVPDLSAKMIDQFAENLAGVLEGREQEAPSASGAEPPAAEVTMADLVPARARVQLLVMAGLIVFFLARRRHRRSPTNIGGTNDVQNSR